MRTAAAGLAILLLCGPLRAEDASTPAAPAAPASTTIDGGDIDPAGASSATAAPIPERRLNIGPYRSVHADDPAALADQLYFQEHVEVRAKPMDRAFLTAKLEWWF